MKTSPTTLPYRSNLTEPRGVSERYLMKGLSERLAVVGFVAEHLEGRFNALAGDVKACRIAARQRVVVLLHRAAKTIVGRGFEIRRIPMRRNDADCLVADAAQERVVHGGPHGNHRDSRLETEIRVRAH